MGTPRSSSENKPHSREDEKKKMKARHHNDFQARQLRNLTASKQEQNNQTNK
jgi:hypothetical protein